MITIVRQLIKTITLSIAQNLARVLSLSPILGSWNSYFSLNHAVFPALGHVLSTREIVAITVLRTLMHLCLYPTAGIAGLLYHVPSLAATGYIRTFIGRQTHVWERLGFSLVPATCIALFIVHPTGAQAWVYSFFWLLPIVTVWFAGQSLLAHALGATFTAHAVGSVLFLLCTPTIPLFWLTLMPRVLLERGIFALGIAGTLVALRSFAKNPHSVPA